MFISLVPVVLGLSPGWTSPRVEQAPAIPKEVRDLEGTYTGAWTMYGIDANGEVVKRMTWTDTLRATGAERKDDRAFVSWECEQVFENSKGPPRKSTGKEGFLLTKDGLLGDNYLEMFGQTTRVIKLSPKSWSYATTAAPQELAALGFPRGATGEHVTVKMVTHEKGIETHHITRLSAVTWTDKDGHKRVSQFVSMKGYHTRDK